MRWSRVRAPPGSPLFSKSHNQDLKTSDDRRCSRYEYFRCCVPFRSGASYISDDQYRCATQVAAAENISVNDLFASAFEERLPEFERLARGASLRERST